MKSGEVNTLKHNYLAFYQNITYRPIFSSRHRTASLSFRRSLARSVADTLAKPVSSEHLTSIS
jgi:hypothetical protein